MILKLYIVFTTSAVLKYMCVYVCLYSIYVLNAYMLICLRRELELIVYLHSQYIIPLRATEKLRT